MYKKDESKSKKRVKKYVKRAKNKLGPMKEKLGESHTDYDDMSHGHDDHEMVSVREAMYRGKHIVVKTHYEVTIDGDPLGAHLGVSNDGTVHYHGLPNYAFASMMDLVRKVIESSDTDLPKDELSTERED